MANRKRSRRDDGTIVSQSVAPQHATDPNVARLTLVLRMVVQGKTQSQIAAYFSRDVRTIRRWIKQAREMGLAVSLTITPQAMVDGAINKFVELEADLQDLKEQAKVENNDRQALRCVNGLRDLTVAQIAVLARIGLFDNFTFPSPHPPNPRITRAQELFAEVNSDDLDGIEGPTIEGEVSDD